jgi:hypothetical protein
VLILGVVTGSVLIFFILQINRRLKKALKEIKQLSGLLPICANCKKIKDDAGKWNQMEDYISNHSEAEFSHGLCPECLKLLYPEYYPLIMGKHNSK